MARQSGSSMTEYVLLGALVICICISGLSAVGLGISHLFSTILDSDLQAIAKQQTTPPKSASAGSGAGGQDSLATMTGITAPNNPMASSDPVANGITDGSSTTVLQTAGANGNINQVHADVDQSSGTKPIAQEQADFVREIVILGEPEFYLVDDEDWL